MLFWMLFSWMMNRVFGVLMWLLFVNIIWKSVYWLGEGLVVVLF